MSIYSGSKAAFELIKTKIGEFLTKVTHDNTLVGDGTTDSPLKIAPGVIPTITAPTWGSIIGNITEQTDLVNYITERITHVSGIGMYQGNADITLGTDPIDWSTYFPNPVTENDWMTFTIKNATGSEPNEVAKAGIVTYRNNAYVEHDYQEVNVVSEIPAYTATMPIGSIYVQLKDPSDITSDVYKMALATATTLITFDFSTLGHRTFDEKYFEETPTTVDINPTGVFVTSPTDSPVNNLNNLGDDNNLTVYLQNTMNAPSTRMGVVRTYFSKNAINGQNLVLQEAIELETGVIYGRENFEDNDWSPWRVTSGDFITTDNLQGNGRVDAPLDLSDYNKDEIAKIDNKLDTVAHDSTLTGDGTTNNPLKVVGGGMSSVTTDTSLQGDGSTTRPLGLSNDNKTAIASIADKLSVVSTTAPITGDGTVNSPISLDTTGVLTQVQHDGSLTGLGTTDSPLGVVSTNNYYYNVRTNYGVNIVTNYNGTRKMTVFVMDDNYNTVGTIIMNVTPNNYNMSIKDNPNAVVVSGFPNGVMLSGTFSNFKIGIEGTYHRYNAFVETMYKTISAGITMTALTAANADTNRLMMFEHTSNVKSYPKALNLTPPQFSYSNGQITLGSGTKFEVLGRIIQPTGLDYVSYTLTSGNKGVIGVNIDEAGKVTVDYKVLTATQSWDSWINYNYGYNNSGFVPLAEFTDSGTSLTVTPLFISYSSNNDNMKYGKKLSETLSPMTFVSIERYEDTLRIRQLVPPATAGQIQFTVPAIFGMDYTTTMTLSSTNMSSSSTNLLRIAGTSYYVTGGVTETFAGSSVMTSTPFVVGG